MSKTPTPPNWRDRATVSISEAAAILGISRRQAYKLLDQGEFPAEIVLVGNMRRVRTGDLRRIAGESVGESVGESTDEPEAATA